MLQHLHGYGDVVALVRHGNPVGVPQEIRARGPVDVEALDPEAHAPEPGPLARVAAADQEHLPIRAARRQKALDAVSVPVVLSARRVLGDVLGHLDLATLGVDPKHGLGQQARHASNARIRPAAALALQGLPGGGDHPPTALRAPEPLQEVRRSYLPDLCVDVTRAHVLYRAPVATRWWEGRDPVRPTSRRHEPTPASRVPACARSTNQASVDRIPSSTSCV